VTLPAPDTALQAYLLTLSDTRLPEQDPGHVLRMIRVARTSLRLYESEVARAAHEQGRSWGDIGREIGMTKQAARRRYAEQDES
jgi:hypothetical protein